ncbi:MAG: LamG domain-containing protein, partial [Burkholderiales bacterium]|nr:LamG domain-containing protein [Burkholderiales bacterium]
MDTRAKADKGRARSAPARAAASAPRLLKALMQRALRTLRPTTDGADKLQLEAFEPRVLMAGDGLVPRIDGRIDVPGEVDRYSFTLAQDVRIVFDSLTNDSGMQWSLDGPDGRVVAPTAFNGSDSASRSGDTAPLLRAGSYTLSVDATGDRTGDYAFRLIDLSRATALQPGQVVSGDLAQGNATDAYRFDAAAGEVFFFDRQLSPPDAYWRLLGPDGRTVFDTSWMNNDVPNLALAQTGSYTLLIEGRISAAPAATAYRFALQPVVDIQRTLVPGQPQRLPVTRGDAGLLLDALQWAEAPPDPALDLRRTVTVEAWVTLDRFSNTYMPLVYKGAQDATLGASRTYALFVTNGGGLLLSTGDGSEQALFSAGGLLALGQRTHVAATIDRDAGKMRLYVNGAEVAVGDVRSNRDAVGSAGPLRIGRTDEPFSGFSPLEGRVDDLRVWNVARSAVQIADARDALAAGDDAGLV